MEPVEAPCLDVGTGEGRVILPAPDESAVNVRYCPESPTCRGTADPSIVEVGEEGSGPAERHGAGVG